VDGQYDSHKDALDRNRGNMDARLAELANDHRANHSTMLDMLESHRSDIDGTFDQHRSDLEGHRNHLLSRLSDVNEGHDSSHSALQDALNQHRLDLDNRFGSHRSEFEATPPRPPRAPSLALRVRNLLMSSRWSMLSSTTSRRRIRNSRKRMPRIILRGL